MHVTKFSFDDVEDVSLEYLLDVGLPGLLKHPCIMVPFNSPSLSLSLLHHQLLTSNL